MENQQQQPQTTSQCRGGCGFYGSPATEGLCSKCFKDSIKRKQDTSSQRISPNSSVSSSSIPADASTSTAASVVAAIAANLGESSNSAMGSGGNDAASATIQLAPSDVFPVVQGMETDSPIHMVSEGIVACDSSASLSSSCSANSLEGHIGGVTGSGSSPNTPAAVKKANRCHVCKKRVGLTGFVCRCGGLYCGEHRYDQAHSCSFDYKTMEREEIRKNNPVVVSDKIQRI